MSVSCQPRSTLAGIRAGSDNNVLNGSRRFTVSFVTNQSSRGISRGKQPISENLITQIDHGGAGEPAGGSTTLRTVLG
jgi:hypothetical protein